MPKTKVRLTICGSDYILVAEEEEDYIRCIADEVEKRMQAILADNPRASITMASVLTALDCYDQYYKANLSADHLRSQIKDYLAESTQNRLDAEEARRQIETLQKENQALKTQLDSLNGTPSGEQSAVPPRTLTPDEFFRLAEQEGDRHGSHA